MKGSSSVRISVSIWGSLLVSVANLIDRYIFGSKLDFEHPMILREFSFSVAFLYFVKYSDFVPSNQLILMVISFSFVATFVLNQRSFNLIWFIIVLDLMKIVFSLIHSLTHFHSHIFISKVKTNIIAANNGERKQCERRHSIFQHVSFILLLTLYDC